MNPTPEKVHDKGRFPFHPGSFIDIFYCNVLQNTEKGLKTHLFSAHLIEVGLYSR